VSCFLYYRKLLRRGLSGRRPGLNSEENLYFPCLFSERLIAEAVPRTPLVADSTAPFVCRSAATARAAVAGDPPGHCRLSDQAGFKHRRADTGAVTLIQRFGSAANLNIHLHWLVLDGVYRNCDGVPAFNEAAAPSTDELEAVLLKIITRITRLLTRLGAVIEEPDALRREI
jgi:hypothetical protein